MTAIDYGPLAGLLGCWQGNQGEDKSPEDDGTETNQYTETIHFIEAGDVDNAETQELAALHYYLDVHRIRDGKAIHHQTGYWIWEAATAMVMHSFTIPRGVSVIAGGQYQQQVNDQDEVVIRVEASANSPDWKIIESPFMQQNARTKKFDQTLIIGPESLSYQQTTLVDIYHYKDFVHSDKNQLTRCSAPD
ncbi:MAG: heme-binding beta-barrel domain-containing protein [Pseudomonadota bacterium]